MCIQLKYGPMWVTIMNNYIDVSMCHIIFTALFNVYSTYLMEIYTEYFEILVHDIYTQLPEVPCHIFIFILVLPLTNI